MHLKDVLKGIVFSTKDDISGLDIGKVACDSRSVDKGGLFVAVRGYSVNGSRYINEAVNKGAAVIVAEEDFNAPKKVKKILIYDTRSSLPIIAGNFYNHPSKKLKTIGVTGTNGKTTITYIMENIVKVGGKGAGVIGTVNYRMNKKVLPSKNTTPGPLELQSMLSDMMKCGLSHAVMEVSSHALDQNRVDCVSFDAGIFTNITREHLDYHKTVDNYFKAKSKLFDRLKDDGAAILNSDDRKVASLRSAIKNRVVTYGIKKDADVIAKDIGLSLNGSVFTARTPKGNLKVRSKLMGMHNISNILAAVAASLALGIDPDAIIKGVESTISVPGRLEPVDEGQPFKVLVDYAHTEDALSNVLSLLKKTAPEKIITVFGCGGNRDAQKRPFMGRVACRLSDYVVITSDNPRFEEPSAIIGEIEEGVKKEFENYDVIVDRRKAIEKAIRKASAGDIVIIAGKGHENCQIVKDKVYPFDDREIAREILKGRK
ncbi:MAG: UDP-N-acetylmuramoyl-L-alanyl-D-glutamate--2,6-diaminopimelate ligase [Candidatus Omnitrophica bacterium]|nr:UDP-N-acetylmuramoyl-L-alanyl-D-glutamate--2,6-diaminopimelate ligase [Candidatus Omnitrophota bacterium]